MPDKAVDVKGKKVAVAPEDFSPEKTPRPMKALDEYVPKKKADWISWIASKPPHTLDKNQEMALLECGYYHLPIGGGPGCTPIYPLPHWNEEQVKSFEDALNWWDKSAVNRWVLIGKAFGISPVDAVRYYEALGNEICRSDLRAMFPLMNEEVLVYHYKKMGGKLNVFGDRVLALDATCALAKKAGDEIRKIERNPFLSGKEAGICEPVINSGMNQLPDLRSTRLHTDLELTLEPTGSGDSLVSIAEPPPDLKVSFGRESHTISGPHSGREDMGPSGATGSDHGGIDLKRMRPPGDPTISVSTHPKRFRSEVFKE